MYTPNLWLLLPVFSLSLLAVSFNSRLSWLTWKVTHFQTSKSTFTFVLITHINYSNILQLLIIAVVTLQTFYLGKHDLLTVYLGKLDFLSVTDFSLGNLPRGNFIVWVLDMSRKQ